MSALELALVGEEPRVSSELIAEHAGAATVEAKELAEQRIAELEPKADLADNYLTTKPNGRLLREVAKALGMRERDLRDAVVDAPDGDGS